MEGDIVKAVKVCMVCVQQDRNGGFHVTSIGGMGTSFCTYTEQALVGWKKKMHVGFVSCSVFLAVLLCIGSSLQTDRREHYKQTCQLSTTSVLIRRHCLQEMLVLKLSSWKISKLSAFCLWRSPWRKWCLWPMCLLLLTRTCLEWCLVFFDGGEEVGCGVDWPLGRGKFWCFFASSLREKNCSS